MGTSAALTLHIPNELDAIGPASEQASEWLESCGVDPSAVFLANLAIEELVTNCIKYAYDDGDPHVVDVELAVEDGQMVLCIVDDGHPFDPMSVPPPDTSLPPEERPIGGLGIHLLREMADEFRYERRGPHNRVTLLKRL